MRNPIWAILVILLACPAHAGLKEERASIVSYCNGLKPDQVESKDMRPSASYAPVLRQNKILVRYFFFCKLWGLTSRVWHRRHYYAKGLVAKREVMSRVERARDVSWEHFFHLNQAQVEDIVFNQAALPPLPESIRKQIYPQKDDP